MLFFLLLDEKLPKLTFKGSQNVLKLKEQIGKRVQLAPENVRLFDHESGEELFFADTATLYDVFGDGPEPQIQQSNLICVSVDFDSDSAAVKPVKSWTECVILEVESGKVKKQVKFARSEERDLDLKPAYSRFKVW